MVDGFGQGRTKCGDEPAGVVEKHPARCGHRVQCDDAEHRGLGERPVHHLVTQPAPAPGCAPREDIAERGGGTGRNAGRQLGEPREHAAPVPGSEWAPNGIGQGRDRAPRVVLASHQPGQSRQIQPGAHDEGPAQLGAACRPDVGVGGGHPVRRHPVGLPDQIGGHRQLDQERGHALVGVHLLRRPAQLPYAEATGAQHGRRGAPPECDEQLELAEHGQGRSTRRAVHGVGPAVPRPDVGRCDEDRAQRPVAAYCEADLPRELDRLGVHPHQQATGEEPPDRALRISSRPAAPDRRPGRQRLEHPALLGRHRSEQLR
jgi:hypothetical protein